MMTPPVSFDSTNSALVTQEARWQAVAEVVRHTFNLCDPMYMGH